MESTLLFSSKPHGESDVFLSFVIPTHKNKEYLHTAIDSILHQKTSAPFAFEILVVSNNPEDDMEDVIARYRACKADLKIYRNVENYGQVGNINRGMELAKGVYVAYLHDDDLILPNYFEEMAPLLQSEKRYPCIVPSMYLLSDSYRFDWKHRVRSVCFAYRFLYRKKLQKLSLRDCYRTFTDVYSAPSCGTAFLKQAVVDFGYFKDERGAAWDFYNYRLFNRRYDVFLLHRYVGVRRTESGMSNEERVQRQFREDLMRMAKEEMQSDAFIQNHLDTVFSGKPRWRYAIFRLRAALYFYSHNLDSKIGIPKKHFLRYHDENTKI